MRPSLPSFAKIILICCFTILAMSSAFAGVNGAIFTSDSTGTQVNGNLYKSKADVYLNGGPQNNQDHGLVPDGTYYFQVTDPSGSVLLSLDDISCRQVIVSSGRITGIPSGAAPAACVDGYHNLGTLNSNNGEQPVQLCNPTASKCPTDFADTPNPGGEYKAWVTPLVNYVGPGPDSLCPTGRNVFGFCDSESKTDNFKVQPAPCVGNGCPGPPPNPTATLVACKYWDKDDDGRNEGPDVLLSGWDITATSDATNSVTLTINGNTNGTATGTTDSTGCTTFTITNFPDSSTVESVTLNETLQTNWNQVAPLQGSYAGGTGGSITVTGCNYSTAPIPACTSTSDVPLIGDGTTTAAPDFGNTGLDLTVTKTATPSFTRTYSWSLNKSVDKPNVTTAGGNSATVNYTVTASETGAPVDTDWQVTGSITVNNPNTFDVAGVAVNEIGDGVGVCSFDAPYSGTSITGVTVPKGGSKSFSYTCTYSSNPGSGTNDATATWDPTVYNTPDGSADSGTSGAYTFGSPTKLVNQNITVKDCWNGTLTSGSCTGASSSFTTLGTLTGTDTPPFASATYTYQHTVNGAAGTCTNFPNTAEIVETGQTASANVKDCQGADLTVSKTATATFNSSISKSVDKTKVEQSGGSVTFNYTVTVTESAWTVSGNITVTNPNDWEDISAKLSDSLSDSGGSCTIAGGSPQTVPRSSSISPAYTCTFAARPTAVSGTNTATATWDATAASTPHGSATGTKGYTFPTLTITDNVQSSAYPPPTGCNATLGTVSVTTTTPSGSPGCGVTGLTSSSWGVFKYSITDTNAPPATCKSYNNTATITGLSSSNPPTTVTVCNTNTGALTMGFWKNTNGQKIITNSGPKTGMCTITPWLRQFNPFADLSSTATCSQVATYVNTTIGAATCGGSTCNPMLKAQMLATALDVYFGGGPGGDPISAYNGGITVVIGNVAIDLSHICSMLDSTGGSNCTGTFEDVRPEFGIASSCQGATVSTMLLYSDYLSSVNGSPVSNAGGTVWYKQIKNPNQVYAKDGFDSVNNQVANIATGTVCTSSF